MRYIPEHPPLDPTPTQLAEWAMRELRRVQDSINQIHDHETYNAEPARPAVGMVRWADGTNWNPGGGAGLYEQTGGGTNGWRMLSSGVQY